jgi:hypothetical protein
MNKFKKLFASLATVALLATAVPTAVLGSASYSTELEGAYEYAYSIGATTMASIDTANMNGNLIRSHMAKMMSNYAKEVLGKTVDTSKECVFTDIDNENDELKGYIIESCQLGLMGQGITKFNPKGIVTRAEFGTVLSRALYGDAHNGGTPYYAAHLEALKAAGIMTNISNPSAVEMRGRVMLMMQRSDPSYVAPVTEEPTEVKVGKLNVSMSNAGIGGDVPHSITALPVVTYKFTADEDINITALTLEQVGFGTNNTLTNAALFIDGKRVSSPRNLDINTKRVINLSNAYTVKKGGSVDIEVRATLGTASEQFAVRLTEVNASAKDIVLASNLTSNTFKIVGTQAATLTFKDKAAVINPKVGATNADIFEFAMENNTVTSKQDVKLYSITLM